MEWRAILFTGKTIIYNCLTESALLGIFLPFIDGLVCFDLVYGQILIKKASIE
jgi:hypothetical protein